MFFHHHLYEKLKKCAFSAFRSHGLLHLYECFSQGIEILAFWNNRTMNLILDRAFVDLEADATRDFDTDGLIFYSRALIF